MPIVNEPESPMTHIPEHIRGYTYIIGLVLIASLIVYDVALGADAGQWAVRIAAVLGLGEAALAGANTPRKKDPHE